MDVRQDISFSSKQWSMINEPWYQEWRKRSKASQGCYDFEIELLAEMGLVSRQVLYQLKKYHLELICNPRHPYLEWLLTGSLEIDFLLGLQVMQIGILTNSTVKQLLQYNELTVYGAVMLSDEQYSYISSPAGKQNVLFYNVNNGTESLADKMNAACKNKNATSASLQLTRESYFKRMGLSSANLSSVNISSVVTIDSKNPGITGPFGILNESSHTMVYSAMWNNNRVALKRLRVCDDPSLARGQYKDKVPLEDCIQEIKIFTHVSNLKLPNLLQLKGYYYFDLYCLLVMDLAEKGSLENAYRAEKGYRWSLRFRILSELAWALFKLHENNVVHCDIKSKNVMLDAESHVKLGDFGLAVHVSGVQASLSAGTPFYMAPELHKGNINSKASDRYSFAMTASEVINWGLIENTWDYEGKHANYCNTANSPLKVFQKALLAGSRPPLAIEVDDEVKSAVHQLWSADADSRPLLGNVHAFFNQHATKHQAEELTLEVAQLKMTVDDLKTEIAFLRNPS